MLIEKKAVKFALDDKDHTAVSRMYSILEGILDNMTFEDNVVINCGEYDKDFVEKTKIFVSDLWAIGKEPFPLRQG